MANLKLNNVIVVAESSGTATLQNSIIKVKADGIKASDGTAAITIADTTGAVSLASNLTVAGNLTVSGTTVTLDTQTVEVEDNILQLNTTQASPDTATAATSGISVYRGNGVALASLIFDDADDTWDLTNNLVVAGTTTITGASTFTGDSTHNGNVVMNKNKKLKQQGACLQSSTHQSLVVGG